MSMNNMVPVIINYNNSELKNRATEISGSFNSVLKIIITNSDHIKTLMSISAFKDFNSFLYEIVNKTIKTTFKEYEILKSENHLYCFLPTSSLSEVEDLANHLTLELLGNKNLEFHTSIKYYAFALEKGHSIAKIIDNISNLTNKFSNTFFHIVKNPDKIIDNINESYNNVHFLRQAILNNEISFAYQPIIKCNNGEIAYYECLLRLADSDHKIISAGRYISSAEDHGLMLLIDEKAVEMAIEELKSSADVILSVNISASGFENSYLLNKILSLLKDSNIGSRLIFELTEYSLTNNYERVIKFISAVKKYGCKIALDDFGTGYASFNQIEKIPLDVIKIDGSLIKDINSNNKHYILVKALISLANDLGCMTTAEYVENGEIAKTLIDLKIDYMQGYFFSPAVNYRTWDKN